MGVRSKTRIPIIVPAHFARAVLAEQFDRQMVEVTRVSTALERHGSPRRARRGGGGGGGGAEDYHDLGALGTIMQSLDAGIYAHLSDMMADEDGDGVVTRDEYRHALRAMGYDAATLECMSSGFEDVALASAPAGGSPRLPPVRVRGR